MKIGRFAPVSIAHGGGSFYGMVDGRRVFQIGDLEDRIAVQEHDPADLKVLTPVIPGKIVAVGLNYKRHSAEMKMSLPEEPLLFLKPPSASLASGENIVYPGMAGQVDYEAELAVVIGRTARNVTPENAADFILGYTAFNDVTARDLQSRDGQWTRAKGFDTFAPFGPYIQTEMSEPGNVSVRAVLNGEIRQNSNTSDMIFPIPYLVSFISRVMTLYPGDLIATGTPEGIGPMKRGDEIRIEIGGLDPLVNRVV